jgi:hypothetical protein
MKRSHASLVVSAAVLALSACGGSDESQPQVTVDDLPAGRYVVSLGDANAPTVGKYHAASDGSRLLVTADGTDRVQQLYRRSGNGAWVAVPAPAQDVAVTLLRSDARPAAGAVEAAALAGSYVAQVATGVVASFRIEATGAIVAGATACKLSGTLSAGVLPATLKLSLASSGCGTALPASTTGVLVVDSDDAPARFRLLGDGSGQVVDLWAFAE